MQNYLPAALLASLRGLKNFDEAAFVKAHQALAQVTSVRLNPNKIKETSQLNFGDAAIEGIVPWSAYGYYLSERPSFTLDPLFHAGAYYVQEASSMFLEHALRQTADLSAPLKILDLCASPGGKSTLIQSLICSISLLVSNDVIHSRAVILGENITRWGAQNIIVTNNDPKDFQRLPGYFDVIVADVPCSGSGLFRKDATAIEEWSLQNVAMCSQRQRRILADVLPSLKNGGSLIYSTCSYSESENEAIADWLIDYGGLSSVPIKTPPDWHIVETRSPQHGAYGYRFHPDKLKGEGFFITVFKKEAPAIQELKTNKNRIKSERLTASEISTVKPYIKNSNDFFFIKQNEQVIAVPGQMEYDLAFIQSALYIKQAGITMGSIIRGELIPGHGLALSTIINSAVPSLEVDKDTALQYLRRQEIEISRTVKGWVLLTYQGLALGWIKVLSNRVNNYYPKNLRILNK